MSCYRNELEKQPGKANCFRGVGAGGEGKDISQRCLPLHYSFNLVPCVFPSATNSLLVANTNYVSY